MRPFPKRWNDPVRKPYSEDHCLTAPFLQVLKELSAFFFQCWVWCQLPVCHKWPLLCPLDTNSDESFCREWILSFASAFLERLLRWPRESHPQFVSVVCYTNRFAGVEATLWPWNKQKSNLTMDFFFFLPYFMACGILIPRQGLNLHPQQWKRRVLITWPPENSPWSFFIVEFCLLMFFWGFSDLCSS